MKNYLIVLLLLVSFPCFADKNDDASLFIKFQSGLFANTESKESGARYEIQLDVDKKMRLEYNYYGVGNYFTALDLFETNVTNTTVIHDFGLSYVVKSFSIKNKKIRCLLGAGLSSEHFQEFSNIVNLGQGFFGGTSYWYDKTTTNAKGFYIKPQIQCRIFKGFEANFNLYGNYNGYRSINGGGLSMNLFRFRIKKIDDVNGLG